MLLFKTPHLQYWLAYTQWMFIFTKKPVHIINYLYALFLNPPLAGYPSRSHTHTHTRLRSVPHSRPVYLFGHSLFVDFRGPMDSSPWCTTAENMGSAGSPAQGSRFTRQLWCCTLKQHPHSTRAINLPSDWHADIRNKTTGHLVTFLQATMTWNIHGPLRKQKRAPHLVNSTHPLSWHPLS